MNEHNHNEQRTNDIYEVLEHYPKPPLIPVSAFNAYEALKNSKANLFQQIIVKGFLHFSNFDSFYNNLSERLESILRKTDNQSGALFGPIVSATISLVDDSRNVTPIERASSLIVGAQSLYKDILSGKFEPDKINDEILEMGQYPNCFSTSQYITGNSVELFKSKNTKQITIILKGRYFVFEIDNSDIEQNFQSVKSAIIEIKKVVEDENKEIVSPGLLTSATSNTQIKLFGEIKKIQENRENLEVIKNSFIIVCLDLEAEPKNDFQSARFAHIENPNNRWYHSSVQLVVFNNSKASIICNFSNFIGGNVMVRVASEIQKRAINLSVDSEKTSSSFLLKVKELNWDVQRSFIEKAKKEIFQFYDTQNSSFSINIGKNKFEQNNLKAVPTFVLALQMTADYYLKKNSKITQFVAISKYRCMDLTTSVVTTKENLEFINKLKSGESKREEIIELFDKAIDSQINELKKSRRTLPLLEIIQLQINLETGWRRFYLEILYFKLATLLGVSGYFRKRNREIIISHPKIFDEVSVIGRPGIKIPYVKYFGLHYQIFEDNIVITMMPGVNWKIENSEFIDRLENNLKKILEIFE